MTAPKAIATIGMLCLALMLPRVCSGDTPAGTDQRDRETREVTAQREFETQAAERARFEYQARLQHEQQLAQRELQAQLDRLHKEIQELRLRELDLRTDLERKELDGHFEDVRERQRDLVLLRHELERRELEVDQLMTEKHRQAERRELVRMEERLDYVSSWRDVAFDPRDAVMMATQSIVELHMMTGEPHGASEALERLLESVEELGSRTAIRFALKDVYAEMGDRERAQEHMINVILENARAVSDF